MPARHLSSTRAGWRASLVLASDGRRRRVLNDRAPSSSPRVVLPAAGPVRTRRPSGDCPTCR